MKKKKKKTFFLNKFISDLGLKNIKVFEGGIKNYFNETKKTKKTSLIARGFPNNYELIGFMKNGLVKEIIFITIEEKIKKTQFAIDNITLNTSTHIADTENPHTVTKSQVGLSNVDNTSDLDKLISNEQQVLFDMKLYKTATAVDSYKLAGLDAADE